MELEKIDTARVAIVRSTLSFKPFFLFQSMAYSPGHLVGLRLGTLEHRDISCVSWYV